MKTKLILSLILFGLLQLAVFARADERDYVWTYDYSSLAKGSSEIEYYMTSVVPDRQTSRQNDWQHQVELEYGITDHFDAALYQVFEQPAGGTMQYAGFKVPSTVPARRKKQTAAGCRPVCRA